MAPIWKKEAEELRERQIQYANILDTDDEDESDDPNSIGDEEDGELDNTLNDSFESFNANDSFESFNDSGYISI